MFEEKFFKQMTQKEVDKWRRAIRKKLVIKRALWKYIKEKCLWLNAFGTGKTLILSPIFPNKGSQRYNWSRTHPKIYVNIKSGDVVITVGTKANYAERVKHESQICIALADPKCFDKTVAVLRKQCILILEKAKESYQRYVDALDAGIENTKLKGQVRS